MLTKKQILLWGLLLFWISPSTAQIMSKLKVNLPEQYEVIFSNQLGTCCGPDNDCPAFNYLHFMPDGYRHKDGNCEIYFMISPIGMKREVKTHDDIFPGSHTIFNRIKWNIGWGDARQWKPSEREKRDMDMLLTWLPTERAKELFNADCAAVLPMNFKGKKCRDKFTWGRYVVFQSGAGLCDLYFLFTDNAKPFEEYLQEIKGAFLFDEP